MLEMIPCLSLAGTFGVWPLTFPAFVSEPWVGTNQLFPNSIYVFGSTSIVL